MEDSKTMAPLANANIVSESNKLLGKTDANGYYHFTFEYNNVGEIVFKLEVSKLGYVAFVQKECWGNLGVNTKAMFYFGLKSVKSTENAFSDTFFDDLGKLDYQAALSNFEKVKNERNFEHAIAQSRIDSPDAFVTTNGKSFLIDKTGWLAIPSPNSLVTIDGQKSVKAKNLNAEISWKVIKSLTPVKVNGEILFAIKTN